jgi:hypothetical protein
MDVEAVGDVAVDEVQEPLVLLAPRRAVKPAITCPDAKAKVA